MRKVISLSIFLFVVCSIFYLNKIRFKNEVWFGGDSSFYHMMAVNYARGHGLMKIGIFGDYVDDYKFQAKIDESYQTRFNNDLQAGKEGGYFSFYHTPGYIFFLGMIYKIFGVSPIIVKQIQLLMIIATACVLPLLGYYYWKRSGLIAGLLGIGIYLNNYAKNIPPGTGTAYPNKILTEGLNSIFLLLFILAFIYWQKNKKTINVLGLGLIVGLNILIKGSTIFLPLIVIIYLIWQVIKKIIKWPQVTGFILGIILVITPWSIYASKISGQKVIISTQGPEVILQGNNEYSLDGRWHREGFLNEAKLAKANYIPFYNQPEIAPLPVYKKLFSFYVAYSEFIPRIFLNKINRGFKGFESFTLALILINYNLLIRLFKHLLNRLKVELNFKIAFVMALPLISLASYCLINWPNWLMNIAKNVNLWLLGLLLLLIANKIVIKEKINLNIPTPFLFLFLNFLFLTLATIGIYRLIQVIDFVFILVFAKQLVDFLASTWRGIIIRKI